MASLVINFRGEGGDRATLCSISISVLKVNESKR